MTVLLVSLSVAYSHSSKAGEIPIVSQSQELNYEANISTATHRNQDSNQYEIMLVQTSELVEVPGEVEFSTGNFNQVPVLRDRHGRSYICPFGGHRIAVFDTNGVYSHSVGRSGHGPGELGRMVLPATIDGEDHLWVWDIGLRRATVFSYEGEFLRTLRLPIIPKFILTDGTILGIEIVHSQSMIGYPVHRANSDGEIIQSFGRETPEYRPDRQFLYECVGALQETGELWLSSVGHYELQLWDPMQGRLRKTINLDNRWFRDSTDLFRDDMLQRPTDLVVGIFIDESDLVWVLIRTSDKDWKRLDNAAEYDEAPVSRELAEQLYDWILQAIDTDSETVIAEKRFDKQMYLATGQGEVITIHEDLGAGLASLRVWRPMLK